MLLYVDVDLPLEDARALEAETETALITVPGARPGPGRGRYRLQLGDFLDTRSGPATTATVDGRLVTAYPTRTGHVAVELDRPLQPSARSTSPGSARPTAGCAWPGPSRPATVTCSARP